jgi:hypothetical protein
LGILSWKDIRRCRVVIRDAIACSWIHHEPRGRPLFIPKPLPILDAPRPDGRLDVSDKELEPALLPPRAVPRPLPRAPLVPRELRPGAVEASLRFSSSSSRRRRSSSRLSSSSAALLSAANCLWRASASCSATSSVAPFQLGSKINRWLCSVCDSIRVQLFSSTEALFTVLDTV